MKQPEHSANNPVYSSTFDNERLAYMATGYANAISLTQLGRLDLSPTDTVLDLGAGTSTELGDAIANWSAEYTAVDKNPAAVEAHLAAGHQAVLAGAENLELEQNSVSVIHARFVMSWLGAEGRAAAWDGLLHAGTADVRGVITEYDWSVANGSPEFEVLLTNLRGTLVGLGFDPDYGSRLHEDVRHTLTERVGPNGFTSSETREPIPAETLADKKTVTQATVNTLLAVLKNLGRDADAAQLQAELEAVLSSETVAITLPDVVSAAFERKRPSSSVLPLQRAIGETAVRVPVETILGTPEIETGVTARLPLGEYKSPEAQAARDLWRQVYTKAGYIDQKQMTTEAFSDAVDPERLLERSDLFVGYDSAGTVISTVRLIHATTEGARSLPTGQKLLDTYPDERVMPYDIDLFEVGEIASFASVAHDALLTLRLVMDVMEAATEAGMKYVLFGAVRGMPSRHFDVLFGPSISYMQAGQARAEVIVKGDGYRDKGIPLSAAYLQTTDFFTHINKYYQGVNTKHGAYVRSRSAAVLARQGVQT